MSVRGKLRKALRCAVFLCILGLILFVMGRIFREKNQEYLSPKEPHLQGRESEVLLLGPSTIMNGVYPLNLWNEYGMLSYNCASGAQSFMASYNVLKELLGRGKPRVVVLDCGRARSRWAIVRLGDLHYATDVMNYWSLERWDMIRVSALNRGFTLDEVMGLALPVLAYHERWQNLRKKDFEKDSKLITYGAKVEPRVYEGTEKLEPYEAAADAALPQMAESYLRKIIALCKEEEIELLLVTMPNMTTAADVSQKGYRARKDAAAAVQRVADECGVVHLNLIDKGEEIGLVPGLDTGDGQHLNYMGAPKFTSFLGAYLRDHYDLPDHRGEAEYAYLDGAYADFMSYVEAYVS